MSLALAIVEDGEGAQRVIEIEVRGAPSDRAADQIARTIANSPLVKTAFAGADPNWGRILAAAGRSGVQFDPRAHDIWIAGIAVCRRGREHSFDERAVHQKMLARHVPVRIDLRSGNWRRAHLDLRLHAANTSTSTPATALNDCPARLFADQVSSRIPEGYTLQSLPGSRAPVAPSHAGNG